MTLPIEPRQRYTVEEYLDLEGRSPQQKLEYRDGLIIDMREALAMAGDNRITDVKTIIALYWASLRR